MGLVVRSCHFDVTACAEARRLENSKFGQGRHYIFDDDDDDEYEGVSVAGVKREECSQRFEKVEHRRR